MEVQLEFDPSPRMRKGYLQDAMRISAITLKYALKPAHFWGSEQTMKRRCLGAGVDDAIAESAEDKGITFQNASGSCAIQAR